MIYTVTFNPSLDYILSVKDFQTGRVNRTSEELIFPGGKGINVSIVLGNMGLENTALGFMAGFTGREIVHGLEDLAAKNQLPLHHDFIEVQEGLSRINVKIRSQEETEINGQGPNITKEDIALLYEKLERLQSGDILVLAGSIPDVMPQSIYMDICKTLSEKNISIVVDATKDLLKNVIPYQPFLIKPNHHELGEMFDVAIQDKKDVVIYGRKLKEMGARNVLVSMAGDGAVLLAEDGHVYEAEAPKGTVVNSVGAGDSMVAGFLTGYIESHNYETAFHYGLCTGSASAFSENLATRVEVESYMASTVIHCVE